MLGCIRLPLMLSPCMQYALLSRTYLYARYLCSRDSLAKRARDDRVSCIQRTNILAAGRLCLPRANVSPLIELAIKNFNNLHAFSVNYLTMYSPRELDQSFNNGYHRLILASTEHKGICIQVVKLSVVLYVAHGENIIYQTK